MLVAQCPSCGTAFKVSLSELGVASGQLQCGQCQALFHAEDPIRTAGEVNLSVPQGGDAQAFGDEGSSESGFSRTSDEDLTALDLDLDAIAQDQVTFSQTSRASSDALNPASEQTEVPEALAVEGLQDAQAGSDPEQAVESERAALDVLTLMTSKVKTWLLPILLSGFLVLQLIWVGAERALSQPSLYGLMAGGCQIFGCHLPPFLDVTRLALDGVKMTAWSKGRAQVSATLVNKASRAQGLPVLKFVLQDNAGRDLGQKLLAPGVEYQLREPGLVRLEPGQPQSVVFEVVEQKSYANAASYRLELVNPL